MWRTAHLAVTEEQFSDVVFLLLFSQAHLRPFLPSKKSTQEWETCFFSHAALRLRENSVSLLTLLSSHLCKGLILWRSVRITEDTGRRQCLRFELSPLGPVEPLSVCRAAICLWHPNSFCVVCCSGAPVLFPKAGVPKRNTACTVKLEFQINHESFKKEKVR